MRQRGEEGREEIDCCSNNDMFCELCDQVEWFQHEI